MEEKLKGVELYVISANIFILYSKLHTEYKFKVLYLTLFQMYSTSFIILVHYSNTSVLRHIYLEAAVNSYFF